MACSREKAKADYNQNEKHFEHGEDELKVAGLFDPQAVKSSDEPSDDNGKICAQYKQIGV